MGINLMTLEWALEVYFNLYLNFCKNIQVMRLLGRTNYLLLQFDTEYHMSNLSLPFEFTSNYQEKRLIVI